MFKLQFCVGVLDIRNNAFLKIAREPFQWLLQAKYLTFAANELNNKFKESLDKGLHFSQQIHENDLPAKVPDDIGIPMTYPAIVKMLLGMAIENACKGILIARDTKLVQDAGSLSKTLKTHNLSWLVVHQEDS